MFVAFERLSAIDAIKKIIVHLKAGEFTVPLVLAGIACLISALGGLLCCVGGFFTGPIAMCAMVCAYETLFGAGAEGPTVRMTTPLETPPRPPNNDLRL
jgi:hypothetical protein